ncbi:MAG TPA: ATP-binding protein [Armatimonadota bacterium]|jgi:signal transduction histidine kinase
MSKNSTISRNTPDCLPVTPCAAGLDPDTFLVFGVDRDWRFTVANEHIAHQLGRTTEAVLGENLWELFPWLCGTAHERYYRTAMAARTPARFEVRDERTAAWYEICVAPCTDGLTIFWLDLSARALRQRAERALEGESTTGAAPGQAKDEFLSLFSHELQTPLTSILGWSEMALDRQQPELMAKAMQVVRRNAVRQKRLVDELLDMSRLQHGRIQLQRERLDLPRQLQYALKTVQADADERSLTLTCVPCAETLRVLADATRLQQCLGNLLHNSLRFTPAGGAITLACHREDAQAVLTVHDTGRGISLKALPSLFAAFHQVNRDERSGGLGLGLAVTRGLVELHGGRIWVESPGEGQGSTFAIALPLA